MMVEERREKRKKELLELAEKYRDKNGNIDLTALRKENPRMYSKIPYYFNNIESFLLALNSDYSKHNIGFGTSMNRAVVRNKLAFDMLNYLREEKKLSYEEIGQMYGVSRMYISKLYRELEKVFGNNIDDTANS